MIEVRREPGTVWITLAQPARGNALSEAMVEAVISGLASAVEDASTHTLVLNAQGPHFCTGFDLSELDDRPPKPDDATPAATDGPLLWRFARIEHLLAELWHAPLRTVALASGRAWGAGADLFAACDLRWATPDTQWRFPGAGFGLVLGTRRLASLVGQDQALRWVAQNERIDAAIAGAAGLTSQIVPELSATASDLPPLAVDRGAYARLKAATREDHRDADLAAVVRSAAQPGLADRIRRYRLTSLAARAPRAAA